MKYLLMINAFLLFTIHSVAQLTTGEYSSGLKLAYDNKTNKFTGYFENYSGWDETTNNSLFSCIFYIEGEINGNKIKIGTYYPADKPEDIIFGTLEIINNKSVKIKLSGEHGGCWNVQHFADEPIEFNLEKTMSWIQIRYIITDKAFFYSDKSIDKMKESYVVKNDFVFIVKIDGDWAYCVFYGKTITRGWMKTVDMNI